MRSLSTWATWSRWSTRNRLDRQYSRGSRGSSICSANGAGACRRTERRTERRAEGQAGRRASSQVRQVRQDRVDEAEDDTPVVELLRRERLVWTAPLARGRRGRVYTIRAILDWKVDRGELFFYIWWRGYAHSESTWEPAIHVHPSVQLEFLIGLGFL